MQVVQVLAVGVVPAFLSSASGWQYSSPSGDAFSSVIAGGYGPSIDTTASTWLFRP